MEDGEKKATTPGSPQAPPLSAVHVNRPLVAANRTMAAVHAALVAAVIAHRALALLSVISAGDDDAAGTASRSLLQHVAMALADLTLLFLWALSQSGLWRPITRATFPDRLLATVPRGALPRVDVLVVTADPDKEPPLGVMNTVVSAMALDYPGGALTVYLSDDAGSPLTLLAARKAYAFARAWVPFCRRHSVQCPWPDRYFAGDDDAHHRRDGLAEERSRVKVKEHDGSTSCGMTSCDMEIGDAASNIGTSGGAQVGTSGGAQVGTSGGTSSSHTETTNDGATHVGGGRPPTGRGRGRGRGRGGRGRGGRGRGRRLAALLNV